MQDMLNKIVEEDLKFIADADLPWKDLRDSTFVVTGCTGFLAGYMVDALCYLSGRLKLNITVLGLVRNVDKARKRFSYLDPGMNVKFLCHGLDSEIDIPEKIDYIVHAASNATPKLFSVDPIGTILPNTLGTMNLLNLAAKHEVKAFLYFSTTGVNGFVNDDLRPIDETCFGGLDSMRIEHCYLESKRMGETMCVAWMHQRGVPVKVVRPAITYGPGIPFDDGRSYADFIGCLVRNRNIVLYSDGSAIRNFCYVADATLGFFYVLLKGEVGQAYNVATDQEISILELAEHLVSNVFPEKRLKVVRQRDAAKSYMRVNFLRTTVDVGKLKSLGWDLSYPLDEGFRRTVDSYLKACE